MPTGNFGDVFAGYVAAQMGLPIERLIVATNVNDILHRALSAGDYSAGSGHAHRRAVDGYPGQLQFRTAAVRSRRAATARRWRRRCAGSKQTKAMRLTNAQREGAAALFTSARADADDMAPGHALGMRRNAAR